MTLTGPISPGVHFTWEEALFTTHRSLLAENRAYAEGDALVRARVSELAIAVLEPMRFHFGSPVVVHSWVRCPRLNEAVGGVRNSQHLDGAAADLHVVGVSLDDVWHWVRTSALPFSQVILEPLGAGPNGWVHVGLAMPGRPLHQVIR